MNFPEENRPGNYNDVINLSDTSYVTAEKLEASYMRAFILASALGISLMSTTSVAFANAQHSRDSWANWRSVWTGDFWTPGNFGDSQHMSCVAVDGSDGGPEFWASGNGDHAARQAYQNCLDYVNVADRNPAYIHVECGY